MFCPVHLEVSNVPQVAASYPPLVVGVVAVTATVLSSLRALTLALTARLLTLNVVVFWAASLALIFLFKEFVSLLVWGIEGVGFEVSVFWTIEGVSADLAVVPCWLLFWVATIVLSTLSFLISSDFWTAFLAAVFSESVLLFWAWLDPSVLESWTWLASITLSFWVSFLLVWAFCSWTLLGKVSAWTTSLVPIPKNKVDKRTEQVPIVNFLILNLCFVSKSRLLNNM